MASKKDKLVESAQKYIAKGQLERAIRDYEQIVAIDSGDIRYRQKLAELLLRVNRKESAIAEYEAISRQYSNNHFYLKAIAVYKQIQKLDPANMKTTLTLASLNEKQGLIGNALAEYNLAVNHYMKAGLLPEAIKVIEQMLAADPDNLNTHLICAETYFTAGLRDKAYGEFTRLALQLRKQSDEAAFSRVCERVRKLFPDKKEFPDDLLKSQLGGGNKVDSFDFSSHDEKGALTPGTEKVAEAPEATLPAESLKSSSDMDEPFHPEWEEEIDLSLLEEEGISIFNDDAWREQSAVPGALESVEKHLKQDEIDYSALEPGDTMDNILSETKHQPEIEPEETGGLNGPFDFGSHPTDSAELNKIEVEIEGADIAAEDWRPASAKTGPLSAGTDEKVMGKESPVIPVVKKKKKYDLDGQINEFKKVLDDQIDKNDTETHYSLGIAYKEMCLFDDAINEFQTASQAPQRRIDCLTLEGVCYRDKGDYAKAEEIFNNILAMQGVTGEEIVSLRYELAILFETVGRQKEALQLYRQVQSDNPGYRDAVKKIALLHGENDAQEQDEIEFLELDVEELD